MYVIYNVSTGADVSRTALLSAIADPLPAGLSFKQVADPSPFFIWNPATLDFVAPPAPRVISKTEFVDRLTVAEHRSFFGAAHGSLVNGQKQNVVSFMMYLMVLGDTVNLDGPSIVTGVNYLQTVGVLGAGRAAQVLA